MAITPHTIAVSGGNPITIYAEPANINYFLTTPLVADTAAGPTVGAASVPAGTRRQYPGDTTPISYSSSSKEFLVDPAYSKGNALPGRPFVLREVGGNKELRQFTFKGRVMDLHAFLMSEVNKDVVLYTNTGAKHPLSAVAAP
jgi:hypothetical protein